MGFERLPGTFAVSFLVSTLLDLTTQATPTALDWKGSLGPDPGTSLNNGAFDYRTFTTLSYAFNDWNLSPRWRHLPKAKSALQAALDSTTGGVATVLGAEDSYDVFDASATRAHVRPPTRIRRRARARRRPATTTFSADRSLSGCRRSSSVES